MTSAGRCAATLIAGLAWTAPLHGQGYRLRLDTRMQSVAYRGWALDSVLASTVVVGPTGGLVSPDGIAVTCDGAAYCSLFRPGPKRSSLPVVGTADLSVWGFGVPGLRLQAKVRGLGDVENRDLWPGVRPTLQLLDGYAEYVTAPLTVEAGRTHVTTRFGFRGFDGGRLELRPFGRLLRLSAYGGWSLARGLDLPVTSPELNPLGDYQPTDRQIVAGGWVAWSVPRFGGRIGYQREDDPSTNGTTFERAALDAHAAISGEVSLAGGADYDLTSGDWGSADVALSYLRQSRRVAVGGRRYRPYFDLWRIWGAFSPVAYSAAWASGAFSPAVGVDVRVRGEFYQFDDPGVSVALVSVEDDGWRWSVGASMARVERWTFNAAVHQERGAGAASFGYEGQATFDPSSFLALTAHGARTRRPLEFRFDDSKAWSYGMRADLRPRADTRIYADVQRYDETRERGDAAALSWNQVRINLGATFAVGSGADHRPLHPAILRIPDARRPR